MRVVGINGSARKGGNTSLLLRHVFTELEKEGIETEMISARIGRSRRHRSCFPFAAGRRNIKIFGLLALRFTAKGGDSLVLSRKGLPLCLRMEKIPPSIVPFHNFRGVRRPGQVR
jgi:hypothetical protein